MKNRIFRELAAALFFLLTATALQATPDPGLLESKLVIGVSEDENFLFYIFVKREQPGSYYTYTDTYTLVKMEIGGKIVESKTFAKIAHNAKLNESEDGFIWKHSFSGGASQINLGEIIQKENIVPLFPERAYAKYETRADKQGLFVVIQEGELLMLYDGAKNPEVWKKAMSGYDFRVRDYYFLEKYLVISYETGDACCIDSTYEQGFLFVLKEELLEQEGELEKKLKINIRW